MSNSVNSSRMTSAGSSENKGVKNETDYASIAIGASLGVASKANTANYIREAINTAIETAIETAILEAVEAASTGAAEGFVEGLTGATSVNLSRTSTINSTAAKASATASGGSEASAGTAVAKTAQTGTNAAKVLGSVAGGLGVLAGAYGIYSNIYELTKGDPLVPHVLNCLLIIKNLEKKYEKDTSSQDCQAHDAMMKTIRKCEKDVTELVNYIINCHRAKCGSDITWNLVGIGSGVCTILAPFTLGTSVAVGAAVTGGISAGGSAITWTGKTINSYKHRSHMYNVIGKIWRAEQQYLKATKGQIAYKNPHYFRFRRNKLCQCIMTIKYQIADDVNMELYSTDRSETTWGYKADIEIDPMARNIEISFDVRGGRQVYACDRSSGCKWLLNEEKAYYKEVFYYDGVTPIDVTYHLAGPSLHSYVYKVSPRAFDCTSTRV